MACLLFLLLSLSLATFPSEPHVNLFTGQSLLSVQCKRWFHQKFERADLRFDRLVLPLVNVVDDEKLAKIEDATSKRNLPLYGGERTRDLPARKLHCSDLSFADLRFVGLTDARLSGAILDGTALQGASLDRAQLQGASLVGAQLRGASLEFAQLQGASLNKAQLQGASLNGAGLQGASLNEAQLQGASLVSAQLQGASLDDAKLQGANLNQSNMTYTRFLDVYVWRAENAACHEARVSRHKPDAAPDEIEKVIERSVAEIPDASRKEQAREGMRAGLDPAKDDTAAIEEVWSKCEDTPAEPSKKEFDKKHADFLIKFVCENTRERKAVAKGIINNWMGGRNDFSVQLARGLLGQDGKECAGAKDLDQSDKDRLRTPPTTQAPAPKQP
jgi:uncharacterized protein YjbI with pentapeptide repeats